VSNLGWLFVALAAVWIGIGAYMMSIAVRQRRLEQRVDELARR
jgi:CcmD family protein